MTNKQMTRMQAATQRREQERLRIEKRRKRMRIIVPAVALLLVLGLTATIFEVNRRANDPAASLDTVKSFPVSRKATHVEQPVAYAQTPPVGGNHAPVWQNCGFYEEPIRNETAVHSLEHGAVWLGYEPNLPEDQKSKLRSLSRTESLALISPIEGLSAPIVASAWGKQIELSSASDPRLKKFVDRYSNGPQTPERGASCSGGEGTPS